MKCKKTKVLTTVTIMLCLLMAGIYGIFGEEGGMPASAKTASSVTSSKAPTASAVPTEQPVKTIESLTVTKAPLELVYGGTLDASQVSLTVKYSDGTTAVVNPDAPISVNSKKIGEQNVIFSYGGSSVSYSITVIPGQVTGVAMKKGTSTSMQIVWDAREEAEAYEIYTASSVDGTYSFVTSTTKNEYLFDKLVQGRKIYVKIRAVSGMLAGAGSEAIAVAAKPERVTEVTIVKSESTSVTFAWKAAKGADGYAVYYKRPSQSEYTFAGSTEGLTFSVKGLSSGKEYEFIVCAYAADISNEADKSDKTAYETAPAVPVISELKGGDSRLKVYWKKAAGAQQYSIYISTKPDADFTLAGTAGADATRIFPIDNLEQGKMYYVKIEVSRSYKGNTLTASSPFLFATTKKAAATSTAAKFYNTLAKFKKSPAYKKYEDFRKMVNYSKSYVLPGMKMTNNGGFNSSKMVPQSIAFAGKYLLISAYDKDDEQESVLYIVDKSTRRYITSLILPHHGHVGGIAYDGTNIWISYGKNLQCLKFSTVKKAAESGKAYAEVYSFVTQIAMPDTASFVEYYKNRIWVGSYNEKSKKYMYGFSIANKSGVPTLKQTNKMLMPDRTQGVAFAADGTMLVSRSCQTRAGMSGFLSRIDVYKPTWKLTKTSVKKNSRKKTVPMPPMNEGIAISGLYTYVVYESPAFSLCQAPVDRVAAFKTSKLTAQKKKKKEK